MTTHRTIDSYTYFEKVGKAHKPKEVFTGRNPAQFKAWKRRVLPKVLATLGNRPARVKPDPELMVEWEEDGLIKQRWVIDTQPGLSAVLLLFRPADMKRGEKRPALLCCHGHGDGAKHNVMGIAAGKEAKQMVAAVNYDYGLQMAKKGFITYAIDWLGFGERSMKGSPHFHDQALMGRDECNINYLCATMLGTTPLAMNCHDGSAATDFVCKQKYVDPNRLGVMGLSQGGTMTVWMALTDNRFKAVDVICYAGPFYDFCYRTYNYCGSQITPGLFALVDTPELNGLIAPRPLLVELGIYDTCFHIDHTYSRHYRRIEKIYKAAGCHDKLELDLAPNEHAWCANKSELFFRKYLKATW